jgi:hypothetical protein
MVKSIVTTKTFYIQFNSLTFITKNWYKIEGIQILTP